MIESDGTYENRRPTLHLNIFVSVQKECRWNDTGGMTTPAAHEAMKKMAQSRRTALLCLSLLLVGLDSSFVASERVINKHVRQHKHRKKLPPNRRLRRGTIYKNGVGLNTRDREDVKDEAPKEGAEQVSEEQPGTNDLIDSQSTSATGEKEGLHRDQNWGTQWIDGDAASEPADRNDGSAESTHGDGLRFWGGGPRGGYADFSGAHGVIATGPFEGERMAVPKRKEAGGDGNGMRKAGRKQGGGKKQTKVKDAARPGKRKEVGDKKAMKRNRTRHLEDRYADARAAQFKQFVQQEKKEGGKNSYDSVYIPQGNFVPPTPAPSASPSVTPTAMPSSTPSARPSNIASTSPSALPTAGPSPSPSARPSSIKREQETGNTASVQLEFPQFAQFVQSYEEKNEKKDNSKSQDDYKNILPEDVVQLTTAPIGSPSRTPSALPSRTPSTVPSVDPSISPSAVFSALPSAMPSQALSRNPSASPSADSSPSPTAQPSVQQPSTAPSVHPRASPTSSPNTSPSSVPSINPSVFVLTANPSVATRRQPSISPSGVLLTSYVPSSAPSNAFAPSVSPSDDPSSLPSRSPSHSPTESPSHSPSIDLIVSPSASHEGAPYYEIDAEQEAKEAIENVGNFALTVNQEFEYTFSVPYDGYNQAGNGINDGIHLDDLSSLTNLEEGSSKTGTDEEIAKNWNLERDETGDGIVVSKTIGLGNPYPGEEVYSTDRKTAGSENQGDFFTKALDLGEHNDGQDAQDRADDSSSLNTLVLVGEHKDRAAHYASEKSEGGKNGRSAANTAGAKKGATFSNALEYERHGAASQEELLESRGSDKNGISNKDTSALEVQDEKRGGNENGSSTLSKTGEKEEANSKKVSQMYAQHSVADLDSVANEAPGAEGGTLSNAHVVEEAPSAFDESGGLYVGNSTRGPDDKAAFDLNDQSDDFWWHDGDSYNAYPAITASPTQSHTEDRTNCRLCSNGLAARYPDRKLMHTKQTCQELAGEMDLSPAASCSDLKADLPLDVEAYCGCEGVNVASSCTFCPMGTTNIFRNVTIPSLKFMSCGEVEVYASYITAPGVCESLGHLADLCCGALSNVYRSQQKANEDHRNGTAR
jgi:hypothetical protein